MAVLCPFCSKTSDDAEFCDHCNSDLSAAGLGPPALCPIGDKQLELNDEQRRRLRHPESYLVAQEHGRRWRVHWIGRAPDWSEAAAKRAQEQSWALPPIRIADAENGSWVFGEVAKEGFAPWKHSNADPDPIRETKRLLETLQTLAETFAELHRLGYVCLNFDPTEFERDAHGRLRFTGLDVRLYPHGRILEQVTIRNSFAAPEIIEFKENLVGPRTDVFHLSLFAYSWLARLLPHGFPGSGLEAFHYLIPPLRVYCPSLPEGVAAVLNRGLAIDPGLRFESGNALCEALGAALERAKTRRAYSGPTALDVGSHSRVGRTKAALKRTNEDHALTIPIGENGWLVAVADGITTCDVGSGELASLFAMLALERTFATAPESTEEFAERMKSVCRDGAETLLAWAIDKGYGEQLALGVDLMGTTLTVGWIQGADTDIANLGDSRVYLIDGRHVEQCTVDGDLASDLLAKGTPPEEILQMGSVSRALRVCMGGCTLTPAGKPTILEDACSPTFARWRFMPGDIVVFCTDGLVEEGAFLEPDMLAQIVREHPHASAQQLAELFCEAADQLQRLPSAIEPDGFGDNVSCVVIRVLAPEGDKPAPPPHDAPRDANG